MLDKYVMSEKLDGIRALWTGKKLLTKKGNEIMAPKWFIQSLPDVMLEGELWAGRGHFNIVQHTVLDRTPNLANWENITFMLFDLPSHKGFFKDRYNTLLDISHKLQKRHIGVIEQYPILSYSALIDRLEAVETMGGEGLMLKLAGQNRKGLKPIKIKRHMDSEGVVIGYKKGKGKYEGMVGALVLKLKNGRILSVGSGLTNKLRVNPPLLGESVTFRYNGYTSTGLPRFARFIRVREPE